MIKRDAQPSYLQDAFFTVREEPVYMTGTRGREKRIRGYKAIVNGVTGEVFSVVTDRYRLIHNQDAYEMADHVVRAVFDGKSLSDFECFNIMMPKTKSSCRIDLIIPNNFQTLFGMSSESYTPFVRISNSYNKTLVLKYEIGFCRWICKNGCIFGQRGITFSMSHTDRIWSRDELVKEARRRIGSIAQLWSTFQRKMEGLRAIALPDSSILPLFCKVFNITVEEDKRSMPHGMEFGEDLYLDDKLRVMALKAKHIVDISKSYFNALGNNAYAAMNILTDYASFPVSTTNPNNYIHGYQRRVGRWVDEFLAESGREDFSFANYIGADCYKYAERLTHILDRSDIARIG